jgi:phenylpropionate dioxygenase-like ring-hydroxylating dioxygenase large terminal subunit
LPVAERHGLVFARATASGAIDVDAHLAGAEDELAPFGLEHYVRFARREVHCRVNWKLVIDTFLEAYHVPTVHARTLAATVAGSPAAFDAFGRGGRMIATRRSLPELRALPEAEWNLLAHTVVLYNLFPNTMLIHQIDHVEVVQAYPSSEGPDASVVTFSLYTPEPPTSERARHHFQSNFDLLLRTIEEEDFPLAEGIQQGFHADPGARVIFGRNEPGVAHYQRMVREALVACGGG